MTTIATWTGARDPYLRAASAAVLTLAVTSIHHAYGAFIYATPWRLHILHAAIPAALAISALLYAARAYRGTLSGRLAGWVGALVILAFPVAMIGFYEGGFNHVLKNIVYFGFGADIARTTFPAPTYEMPNDLLFELTGIVQFPISVWAAMLTVAMLRGR